MSEIPYGIIDTSKWPTVVGRLVGSPKSDQDLQLLFDNIDSLYSKQEIFVVIFDLQQADYFINPMYIYAMVKHMQKMHIFTQMYIACLCLVVSSNAMVNTIEWVKTLRSPSIPWYTFQSLQDAFNHINQMRQRALET